MIIITPPVLLAHRHAFGSLPVTLRESRSHKATDMQNGKMTARFSVQIAGARQSCQKRQMNAEFSTGMRSSIKSTQLMKTQLIQHASANVAINIALTAKDPIDCGSQAPYSNLPG
ncbi:MAG: hypothetical protein R3E68_13690 [Burkholderiaceae bacterium]